MNVVIYARFSSHSQTEQSIEGQLKACYEYAERNSYTVIGEYIDRALTGTNDNRPEFLRMMRTAEKRPFRAFLPISLTASHEIGMIAPYTRRSSRKMAFASSALARTFQKMQVGFLLRAFLRDWPNITVRSFHRKSGAAWI